MDDRLYWLGFSAFPGIGPARFQKLLAAFGQAQSAWKADVSELKKSGVGEILAHKLVEFRENFSTDEYLQKLNNAKVKFLTLRDPEYPAPLSRIKNPPFVLYVKGDFDFHHAENQKTIAFVGSRKITSYGTQVTELLVGDLAEAGCVIVSGLAIGVDSVAHRKTIQSGGKTIAVLGSGVDCCYPAQNISLYRKILETGGAIVSEYPLGQEPTKGSFPSRNRIIAGLSIGVVVTEGAADSGALITAEDAFLNKRKVFAIPGPITSNYSKGPNALLARGAIPVTQSGDILQALAIPQRPSTRKIFTGTAEEQKIIVLLQNTEMHIDELIKRMNIPASKIGTTLSIMEMKGLLRNLGSGIFALADIS